MKYFNKLECHKINVPSDVGIMRNMVKSHAEKELFIQGNLKN